MDIQPGSYLRRLREDPLDAVNRIAGEIGPRRATALAEAQAAAYIDGRLRLAGLRVSVDPFPAPANAGADGLLIALLALAAVALYYWYPYAALFLSLVSLVLAGLALRQPTLPLLGRRRASQNVIATRAAPATPRWRVVLLAPLDSPVASGRLAQLLQSDLRPLVGRVIACSLLALLGLAGLFDTLSLEARRALWYAQWLPAAYLVVLAVLDAYALIAPATPGGVNHAGALATLLGSADALNNLSQTELWAVALGATNSTAGLTDLLRRYPFDREMTFFVGIEGVGSGTLSYLSREGLLRERRADRLLRDAAAAADADDPLINAEPRHYAGERTIGRSLLRADRRALTITCLDADGRPPRRGSLEDTPDAVDAQTLDRAVRLIAGIVRKIDSAEIRD